MLDWLAVQIYEDGWSLKNCTGSIMLSSTYRQSSDESEGGAGRPENMLVWRMNRRALDFEATRDALLAASGEISTERWSARAVDF